MDLYYCAHLYSVFISLGPLFLLQCTTYASLSPRKVLRRHLCDCLMIGKLVTFPIYNVMNIASSILELTVHMENLIFYCYYSTYNLITMNILYSLTVRKIWNLELIRNAIKTFKKTSSWDKRQTECMHYN